MMRHDCSIEDANELRKLRQVDFSGYVGCVVSGSGYKIYVLWNKENSASPSIRTTNIMLFLDHPAVAGR